MATCSGNLLADLWSDDYNPDAHDLHQGPVTDWEWHSSWECRRGMGVRKITNPHALYENGVSVPKSIRANRHAMPSEGWMCGPSNPHIRLFQKPNGKRRVASFATSHSRKVGEAPLNRLPSLRPLLLVADFHAPASVLSLIADPQIRAVRSVFSNPASTPIPHPQTIFRAFTQQNRMSSPPNPQKTNNPLPINKIKLSPKRFLVMVNPVE